MPARKMLFHADYVREKIRASQLLNRLQKCAFGEIDLTMTQLRAIEILLRKSIPDLAAAEIKTEHTHRYVIEIPAISASSADWEREANSTSSVPTVIDGEILPNPLKSHHTTSENPYCSLVAPRATVR